jgi:hypothetical protein
MSRIQVPKTLIAHYLGRFVDEICTSDIRDISDENFVDECFNTIKLELTKFNEQTHLAAGLKHLLDNVKIEQYINYSNQEESLTDEDMDKIVRALHKNTMPVNYDDSLRCEITAESLDESRIKRGIYYKAAKGETLESIAQKFSIPTSSILQANPFLARKFQADKELPEGTTLPLGIQVSTWIPTSK